MNEMSLGMTFLLVVMIFSAIIGIALILMQSGSADVSSGEGAAAGGVFGSRGPSGFLARATVVVSAVFFISVLGINYIGIKHPSGGNSLLTKKLESPAHAASVPVVPSSSSETK